MDNFITRAFQRHKLKKLPSLNKRIYTPLPECKKVGFVFNSQEEAIATAIAVLEKGLKEHKISYQGLGISYTKDESTNQLLDHDAYVVQVLKKEADWLGIPIVEQAEKFYKDEYDIVFDLSLEPSFPIEYSLKRCKCKMIVGFSSCRESLYDITIQKGETKGASILDYVTQSLQYLTIIKSK